MFLSRVGLKYFDGKLGNTVSSITN